MSLAASASHTIFDAADGSLAPVELLAGLLLAGLLLAEPVSVGPALLGPVLAALPAAGPIGWPPPAGALLVELEQPTARTASAVTAAALTAVGTACGCWILMLLPVRCG
ncbi:MAG: hypothetical protein ABI140_08835 [Jatrophihabitantaceae bacterium]